MKAVLFGATGMVGQGVLRESLADPRVDHLLTVGRTATGQANPKLAEIVLPDLAGIAQVGERLSGFDACFFCAGVSSAGLSEPAYTALTFDLTLSVARVLARENPAMTFLYVSGAGTGTKSRFMWARVKGRTEDALRALPFKGAYMFRSGFIQPLHGTRSKTGWVQALYSLTAPLVPLLERATPGGFTTTERVGRAMIGVAREGYPKPILETADINAAAGRPA